MFLFAHPCCRTLAPNVLTSCTGVVALEVDRTKACSAGPGICLDLTVSMKMYGKSVAGLGLVASTLMVQTGRACLKE